VASGAAVAGPSDEDRAFELTREGMRLAEGQRYAEARALLDEVVVLWERIASADPKNEAAASNVKVARHNALMAHAGEAYNLLVAGGKQLEAGRHEECEASFAASVEAYREVVAKDPDGGRQFESLRDYSLRKGRACRARHAIASGGEAPDLSLQGVGGAALRLSSLRGRPALVVVWAVWCPLSKQFLAVADHLHGQHEGRGLAVVGLNADRTKAFNKNEASTVAAFARREIGFPVYWATDDDLLDLGDPGSLPVVLLVGEDGRFLRQYDPEAVALQEIEADVAGLLGE
jgi:hypothetical protein